MSALGELEQRGIDQRVSEMDDPTLVWLLLNMVRAPGDDPSLLVGARNRRMMEVTRLTVVEAVSRFVPGDVLSAALETQQ